MNRLQFKIKPTEGGYGIFLRRMQERPLQILPDKQSAKDRLRQYLKYRKERGK